MYETVLIEGSNQILQALESRRLLNMGDLVLELIWKTFVELVEQGLLIPASLPGVSVEIDSVSGCFPQVLEL